MTVCISDERQHNLLDKVQDFAKSGKCQTLKDFQSIAGHINWSFAVFPLLKPALSALYSKIANKSQLMASVHVNNAVQEELLWIAKHAHNSDGIFLLRCVAWDPSVDTHGATVCFTDACLDGMAYWFPELALGLPHSCQVPVMIPGKYISKL